MDQGALHEAFNMASLWKLPVIYVVENNMMSMGTHLHRHSWTTDLTLRGGPAYGMPGILVDGNDIEEMAQRHPRGRRPRPRRRGADASSRPRPTASAATR